MKFKVGQEVTPNKKSDQWTVFVGPPKMPIPEFGKIYTVRGYPLPELPEMLELEEIPGNYLYHEECFEPLVPSAEIEMQLEEVITSFDNSVIL